MQGGVQSGGGGGGGGGVSSCTQDPTQELVNGSIVIEVEIQHGLISEHQ